jgi:hypothetical protein
MESKGLGKKHDNFDSLWSQQLTHLFAFNTSSIYTIQIFMFMSKETYWNNFPIVIDIAKGPQVGVNLLVVF